MTKTNYRFAFLGLAVAALPVATENRVTAADPVFPYAQGSSNHVPLGWGK